MNPLQGVVNVRLILDAIIKRLWLIPLCAVITGLIATKGTNLYKPKHVSSAKVLVQENSNVNPFLSDMMVDWKLKTRLPIITNVMNFAKPAAGQEALLSLDDARTLFHEFGHALHGMLSDVTYPSLAGTSVSRDFVELP